MRANPLPLINGFYADETRPWSQQDVVNWIPCAAEQEGTRTPLMLKTPPGLSPYARVSGDPVRGTYNAEGRFFSVMGNALYQITTTATSLGSISGVGRVRFAHNQITGGNQVLIVNGSAGFVWNTNTSTLTTITDTGYPGAIDAVFIDGYLVQIEPARRFAFNSDLADALNYNTLDRFTSEVSPDLLVGLAVSNNELLLFSENTLEFFENTGASQQPFRSKRISCQRGAAGRYTIAQMDNTVYWLGNDGKFYVLEGYTPKRISNRPIEQMIRGLDWSQAVAMVWENEGHSVCYWTFNDGKTIGFDASQQKWHRRASYGLERWRVNSLTYWKNRWFAGDFQKGRIWELDWLYPWEYDQEFISECVGAVLHDNQSRVLMPRLEVIMDTGQEEVEVRDFVIGPAALALAGDLPNGLVNDAVSFQYVRTGGVPDYVFSIASGALPTGLSLNAATGLVTGTLAARGNFSWTVRVTDGDGATADRPDTCAASEITWPSFGWTAYTDADAGGGFAPRSMVYAADKQKTASLGYSTMPGYSADGGLTFSLGTPLTNGGDGDYSPTLGRAMILRSNTDRHWSSTDLITYTNHLQPVNISTEPVVCWASDLALFFGLSCTGSTNQWIKSTTGTSLTTGTVTGTIPVNMQIILRAQGATPRYFVFANSTPAATNRIAYAAVGESDWAFIGSVDTYWRDAKYVSQLGKVFAVGHISGTPASRKVVSIDPSTLTVTDVTPTLPAGFDPSGIAYSPELGLLVMTGIAAGSSSCFTSTTGAASSWTERTTFPSGNFTGELCWQGSPFYRFIQLKSGGVGTNGVVYSNTVITPP